MFLIEQPVERPPVLFTHIFRWKLGSWKRARSFRFLQKPKLRSDKPKGKSAMQQIVGGITSAHWDADRARWDADSGTSARKDWYVPISPPLTPLLIGSCNFRGTFRPGHFDDLLVTDLDNLPGHKIFSGAKTIWNKACSQFWRKL